MENGTLIVETYTSIARIPLANTNVFVTNEDSSRLMAYRKTDISGKIEPVTIEAPDSSLAESPQNAAPFTVVNVYINKENYFNLLVVGVQIFGGEESLQRIQMVPIPENYTGSVTNIIRIEPQNL